ncbi:uncharacterized protein [Periplaneta americana]|uniref:uncharacterized protein n=1 Tax=Periplaneta americana TaxID=6978 RepID=UPI0037E96039
MSLRRIQNLLYSEYNDFEDMVVIESPFAETTRDGKGIRQVQLGLTPTKLIIAKDIIQPADDVSVYYSGIDPAVENFELTGIYPVERVNLNVFRRRKKYTLKAHFCNNKVLYYELGGLGNRQTFWNSWCERVKFLSPDDPGSSCSETSVASSTSISTVYLPVRKVALPKVDRPHIWCHYGAGGDAETQIDRDQWVQAPTFMDTILHPRPGTSLTEVQTLYKKPRKIHRSNNSWTSCTSSETPPVHEESRMRLVNRFGSGIPENCIAGLYLPEEKYVVERRWSQHESECQSVEHVTILPPNAQPLKMYDMVEYGVLIWEENKAQRQRRRRHPRRYGFSSQWLFLHGLGPWHVAPGERHSIQVKKTVSSVTIRRQPADSEMRLPISRRQLSSSISCDSLRISSCHANSRSIELRSTYQPVLYFWTPGYWYRPKSFIAAYHELHHHLQQLHRFQESCVASQGVLDERRNKLHKLSHRIICDSSDPCLGSKWSQNVTKHTISCDRTSRHRSSEVRRRQEENYVAQLNRRLKMKLPLRVWDFDSITLAYQITMIDRTLFLKIPDSELGVLIWQRSSKNAPNIGAVIAFAHRISCLISSEIMKCSSQKERARLVTKFINVADKCNRLQNFQSCHSVLAGLKSPAVYRLQHTWAYVRQHHATKYHAFEKLCRRYRDPRLPCFQRAFHKASLNPPYLPYIGDILARLLGRVPNAPNFFSEDAEDPNYKHQKMLDSTQKKDDDSVSSSLPNMIRRFLSAFRMWLFSSSNVNFFRTSTDSNSCKNNQMKKDCETVINMNEATSSKLIKNLDSFFEPVFSCENIQIQRLQQISILLNRCQIAASNYAFSRNNVAWEYLLKQHYKEEKDIFFYSFNLEPRNFHE